MKNTLPASTDQRSVTPDQRATATFFAEPFWQHLLEDPHKADLFSVLRWIDSRDDAKPLLGRSPRPHFEPVRLAQEPSLAFAASTIAGITQAAGEARPRLSILGFGLFGPNGPMPLHLTEYARDRLRRFNDPTLAHFADIFHHRLILLFYRAWADTQSTVSMDRPDDDRFTRHAASLIGYGQSTLRARDDISDHAKLFHAQHLARQTRNPEGLAAILSSYFSVPVSIVEFVSHWIALARSEQTRLASSRGNNRLGETAIIGEQVLDAQHKVRITMGPMSLARYQSLLPGCAGAARIAAWLRTYLGLELLIDLRLVLQKNDVFSARLGCGAQLGWTSWLDTHRNELDAADLVLGCDL